ncbi:hypothetical protein E1212_12205 [Jiangella ureilytica]|uniref:Uncharacterized protein n=1 Tax=Jiangella ureilytica TaxID=2530374 RepID=A0A4R4RSD9_9ACTN|nr:hypothetical protein [Jiangella ureilytica]TDC51353.1 hypothetical protein E1212_12205 [Jiangella ureilytica]
MTIEEELELALRAEALRIDPPVVDLVEGGVERGLALQRRFRARLAVGTAALVLVAGAGTVLVVPFLDGDDGGSGPVAAGDDAETGTDAAGTAVAAPPQAEPAGEIDPDAVVDAVVALLPPGEITEADASDNGPDSAWFSFVWDDGTGASWVSGEVSMVASDPGCPVVVNGGSCEFRTLDDGTTLQLQTGPYYPQPDREPDRRQTRVTAVAPTGLSVHLAAMNAPTEKQSEPTRAEPPFSVDQLAAVVTDGVWAELTAGVTPPAPESSGQPQIPDESRALADALGAGWAAGPETTAIPGPEVTTGLPEGVIAGAANLITIGSELSVEQHCIPMEEKGRITHPCTTTIGPGGVTVHVQRATTTLEGPYAQGGYGAELLVIAGPEHQKTRVAITVSDTAEDTTPERREAMDDWLSAQVEAFARAATAGIQEAG